MQKTVLAADELDTPIQDDDDPEREEIDWQGADGNSSETSRDVMELAKKRSIETLVRIIHLPDVGKSLNKTLTIVFTGEGDWTTS